MGEIVKLNIEANNVTKKLHVQCPDCKCALFFVTSDGVECNACHEIYDFAQVMSATHRDKQ